MYAMSDYEKPTTQKYNLRSNMVSPLSLRILIFRHEVCCTVALPSLSGCESGIALYGQSKSCFGNILPPFALSEWILKNRI